MCPPSMDPIHIRLYGSTGPVIVLLHGGPGAPGYVAPIARELSDAFQVIEPFQRGATDVPLTVARHVMDLHDVIQSNCGPSPPALVGHSWGAMLALAYAARHPGAVRSLALIGCGTFNTSAREKLKAIRARRMDADFMAREAALTARFRNPDDRLKAIGSLYQRVDSVDLLPYTDETASFDARAHDQTWSDMIRLQESGVFPQAF